MKVFIGKPPNILTSDIYTNYMDNKYGLLEWPPKSEQTTFEHILEYIEDGLNWLYSHTINQILNKREQKIKVRIDPHDTWSMDETLSHIIVPMLKQLKEEKHGAPFVDNEDVPEYLRSKDLNNTDDEKFFERWDWVMDEMIFAFECYKDDNWEDQFFHGDFEFDIIPIDKHGNVVEEKDAHSHRLVPNKSNNQYFDQEGYKQYRDRIDNGMRLFSKYYSALWD